jgi:hypothetical protein
MSEKTTIWILVALVAYVMFKDRLFGSGGISGAFTAGTVPPSTGGYGPAYGPAPSGNTYANTPPGTISPGPQPPPPHKNFWDVVDTAITTGGAAYDSYSFNN